MSNNKKLKRTYKGIDTPFDQKKQIQIQDTLKKEQLKVKDSFQRLERKIEDGLQLADSDVENIIYES